MSDDNPNSLSANIVVTATVTANLTSVVEAVEKSSAISDAVTSGFIAFVAERTNDLMNLSYEGWKKLDVPEILQADWTTILAIVQSILGG